MRKQHALIMVAIAVAAVLALSCSGGAGAASGGSGGVLKELPAIAAKAVKEYEALEADVMKHQKAGSFEKAMAADKKRQDFHKEKYEEMKKWAAENEMDIEFKQDEKLKSISVTGVKLKGAVWNRGSYPHINLHIAYEAKKDIKSSTKFMVDYLDKDGNVLKSSKAYVGFGKKPKVGESGKLSANPKLDKLGALASILVKNAE